MLAKHISAREGTAHLELLNTLKAPLCIKDGTASASLQVTLQRNPGVAATSEGTVL